MFGKVLQSIAEDPFDVEKLEAYLVLASQVRSRSERAKAFARLATVLAKPDTLRALEFGELAFRLSASDPEVVAALCEIFKVRGNYKALKKCLDYRSGLLSSAGGQGVGEDGTAMTDLAAFAASPESQKENLPAASAVASAPVITFSVESRFLTASTASASMGGTVAVSDPSVSQPLTPGEEGTQSTFLEGESAWAKLVEKTASLLSHDQVSQTLEGEGQENGGQDEANLGVPDAVRAEIREETLDEAHEGEVLHFDSKFNSDFDTVERESPLPHHHAPGVREVPTKAEGEVRESKPAKPFIRVVPHPSTSYPPAAPSTENSANDQDSWFHAMLAANGLDAPLIEYAEEFVHSLVGVVHFLHYLRATGKLTEKQFSDCARWLAKELQRECEDIKTHVRFSELIEPHLRESFFA